MRKLLGPRFGIEVGVIVAVAVLLGLLEASWPAVAGGIFATWLVIAAVEIALSRDRAPAHGEPEPEPAIGAEPAGVVSEPLSEVSAAAVAAPTAVSPPTPERTADAGPDVEPPSTVPPLPPLPPLPDDQSAVLPRAAAIPIERTEETPAPEPELAAAPVVEPEPPAEPEPAVEAEGEPIAEIPPAETPAEHAAEPDSEPEAAPLAPPPPPVLTAVPPAPSPELEPVAEAEPERAPVVELRPGAPREWNLWELERIARENAGDDAVRDEEWSFLLMYLREFASADGALPRDFDQLVRDSFGEALHAPR